MRENNEYRKMREGSFPIEHRIVTQPPRAVREGPGGGQ